nr:hypothetical protein [Tanacetum cinerariifolium]
MVINLPCLTDKKELAIPGQTTTDLKFVNQHNMFWNTASSKTIHFVKQIHAIVDGKAIVIPESSVSSDHLFDDEDGITYLTTDEIFENLALIGYEQLLTKLTFQKGGNPRRQETIGGTPAQTRSESMLKQPNEPPLLEGHTSRSKEGRMEHTFELTDTVPPTRPDSPLTGGYIPRSDEGRLKLLELMNICTTLSNRGRMIREIDKDENVNLVSVQEEVHKTDEPLKENDDATLAETLPNIKWSTTKDKGKCIMQETEPPKKINKREMIQLSLDEELAQKLHAEKFAKETARQEQEKYNLEKALELQK